MFKKWDIIIIIALIVISFLPEVIFASNINKNFDMTYAEITIGGKLYSTVPLSTNIGEKKIEINENGHHNVIIIKDKSVSMIEANCKDSYCIEDGSISKGGQSLVCLPNKVMVEIKGETSEEDDIIISY